MSKKDIFGFLVLPAGLIAGFGGIHFVSGGDARGWGAIVLGLALVVVAFRAMRAKDSTARSGAP